MIIRSFSVAAIAGLAAVGAMSNGALAQLPLPPSPCPSVLAQRQPPSRCARDPHFRDFDFWLGEWQVTNLANGNLAGTNIITSIEGACALEERWTGARGSTGMSINFYNSVSGQWRQVWVTAGAYSIDIVGGLNEEGSMVLEGTIYYYRSGKSNRFRGTWTPNPDGSVRQHFQQADGESGEWSDWFDGLYVKVKKTED